MKRRNVFKSDRILVTENIIRQIKADSVLEIGAGDHSFDYVCKERGINHGKWIKADFSPPCNIICDLNRSGAHLPFRSKKFDLVICTQVLEHLLWPQALLAECRRVLSDGGKLLISVPNITSLTYRAAWMLGHIPSCAASGNLPSGIGNTAYELEGGALVGGHVIDFNRKRTERLLNHSGFKIISVKGSGIIWHRQVLPHWAVPASLSSNIICLGEKKS